MRWSRSTATAIHGCPRGVASIISWAEGFHRSRHPAQAVTRRMGRAQRNPSPRGDPVQPMRSEEHTSELQSLMRISYAVFCLKKKKNKYKPQDSQTLSTHRYLSSKKHLN